MEDARRKSLSMGGKMKAMTKYDIKKLARISEHWDERDLVSVFRGPETCLWYDFHSQPAGFMVYRIVDGELLIIDITIKKRYAETDFCEQMIHFAQQLADGGGISRVFMKSDANDLPMALLLKDCNFDCVGIDYINGFELYDFEWYPGSSHERDGRRAERDSERPKGSAEQQRSTGSHVS